MAEGLRAYVARSFVERGGAPRLWSSVTYVLPRWPLVAALAVLPALAFFALAVLNPFGIGEQATERGTIEATFARFISGLITAATIAVSVAAVTLTRELRGIQGQRDHHRDNQEFRARVYAVSGRRTVPLALGPFLAVQLETVADAAATARARATPAEMSFEAEGATVAELVASVEERARAMARVAQDARRPHHVLKAALDFEQELTHHLARRFSREHDLSAGLRAALEQLAERIEETTVTTHYAKTLDIQWTLSRMSTSILVCSLVAVLAAAGTVLFYPDNMADRAGLAAAAAVLAVTLGLAVLPIAAAVGFLLRVMFVNQNTLPSADFILGPEQPAVAAGLVPRRASRGRTRAG